MHKKLVNCDTHIDDLVNSIKSSIKNKTPFSYVRLGDVESTILKITRTLSKFS
jgi:hypothetical protein